MERLYVDAETEKSVEREDQIKEYTADGGRPVVLEAEEIAAAVPDSDKMLRVEAFIPCAEVDTLYLDRPYYLTPAETGAQTAFAVIRDGLAKREVVAVARTVLFRRVRSVMLRRVGDGLVAHTLEYDHEVRDANQAFNDVAASRIDKEMLELAEHIIRTKRGKFDPSKFEDRYDEALAELVKAKAAGKALPARTEPSATEPVDLLKALRDSTKLAARRAQKTSTKRAPSRRKAG